MPGLDPKWEDASGEFGRDPIVAVAGGDEQPIPLELLRERFALPVIPGGVSLGGVPAADHAEFARRFHDLPKGPHDLNDKSRPARDRSPVGPIRDQRCQPLQAFLDARPLDAFVRQGFRHDERHLAQAESRLRFVRERQMSHGRGIERRWQQAQAADSGQPTCDRAEHYFR